MNNLVVPVCLVALGVFFIAIEAFIPSAGVLGFLAAFCLFAGVVSAFWYGGLTTGTAFLAATFIGVSLLVAFLIRRWPHTTLGKLILVEPAATPELLPDRSELHAAVGRVGQALSLMLPSGLVEIAGKRFDATSESTVEEGTWVEVVRVRNGTVLVVRPISEELALKAQREQNQNSDPLEGQIDEVVPDPFAEPLG